MPAANRQLQAAKKKHAVTGYDTQSLKLTLKYFGSRSVATAGAWFANDVFFYGNKLFQSKFIKVIEPNSTSVITSWSWNVLNIAVELAGYHGAMWSVDNKLVGRKWLQIVGFMLCFILFIVPACAYHHYTEAANIHSFQAMYYLTSFFNQFGPNCVTFLVAAEVFPTSVRATAHGLGAATGKLGALVIAIVGSYTTTQQQFYIVPWFGLFGALVTLIFLPDTTGLDLHEQERYWSYLRSGREHAYHGTAVHPQHLSSWERWRGKGKHYDGARDYEQKVRDFRAQWETAMAESVEEKSGLEADDEDEKILEGPLAQYFLRTRAGSTEKEGLAAEGVTAS